MAPHFGDFVIGMPAAVENTAAALAAGSTAIGNLGQYFTFKLPHWDDDVGTTAETVKALAMCAAQPEEVLIHSNLDDGFAAMFTDLACGIGMVLLERAIVEGEQPEPVRWRYTGRLIDLVAQRLAPTGHGLNPVPVTEALRIPEIDEIVDAHLFANRLASRSEGFEAFFDLERADAMADRLVEGGRRFERRVLEGLTDAGIDIGNPFELLLSLRRIGAKRLEELWGPGASQDGSPRGRVPVVRATTIAALESQGEGVVMALDPANREAIERAHLTACVTCTDVHEYGKILVETVLGQLGVTVVDAGVSEDPETVAARASDAGADMVAVSTYSGVALRYITELREAMESLECDLPIFVGGKLNEVPDGSPSSMPEDVSRELDELGAVVCLRIEDMLGRLVEMAREVPRA